QNHLQLAEPTDINLYKANADVLSKFKMLPSSLRDACESALNSDFIKQHIPNEILEIYCHR
ncbi:MAG: type I glutamate--ammonia ligase, partial [Clostridium sp.]|nr:type I glutamate--ammonia ligase [Clostridium sp.]